MDRHNDVIALFQNIFISRRSRVVNYADIVIIATMFIKTTCKDSKKIKRIRNYVLKCNLNLPMCSYHVTS